MASGLHIAIIGDRDCANCHNHPSHLTVPCFHPVCYGHIFSLTEEQQRGHMACGICGQFAFGVQGIQAPPMPAQAARVYGSTRAQNRFVAYTPEPQTPQSGFQHSGASYTSGGTSTDYQSSHYNDSGISADTSMLHFGFGTTQEHNMFAPPSPNLHVREQPLDDPFVEAGASQALGQSDVSSPSALAQLIKSGAFEDSDMAVLSTGLPTQRTYAPIAHNQTLHAQPLVRLWSSHMLESIPNPPFVTNTRSGQYPSLEEAINYQPFILPAGNMPVSQGGVVLVKNIPYASTKAEIIAAIGRNARIVSQPAGSPFYAIHIIMERSTGKTMDCYVELESKAEARSIFHSYRSRCDRGRAPRVGERHIEVELSSQEDLMEQLFPKARCVTWDGQEPTSYQPKEAYNSGFMGFVTVEECAMLVKHAENPQRSPFVARALNRAYECLISVLHKYPWFATSLTTIGERALLHRTTVSLLRVLFRAVSAASSPNLSQSLLQELLCAALTVPFSHRQKLALADLAAAAGFSDLVTSIGYAPLHPLSGAWPFDALDRRPGTTDEVVSYYAALLRLASPRSDAAAAHDPFGGFRPTMERNDDKGDRELTVRAAAAREWDSLAAALERVLTPAQQLLTPPEKTFDAAPGAGRKRSPPSGGSETSGTTPPSEGKGNRVSAGRMLVGRLEAGEQGIPGLGAGVGVAKVRDGVSFADMARKN